VALATTAIGSIPLWMIAASHPEPMILGLVVGLLPLIAIKGVTSVRCPRCKGYLGVRTGFAIASWGMGGHTRIDYCESCQVSLDEPREGPRRDPVDDWRESMNETIRAYIPAFTNRTERSILDPRRFPVQH